MTLARGGIGGGGKTPPSPPTTQSLTRVVRQNGTEPRFTISFNFSTPSPKATIQSYTATLFYLNSGVETAQFSQTVTNGSTLTGTMVLGRSYYARIRAVDSNGLSATSQNTGSLTALTLPGDVGTVTLSGGTNTLSGSWAAVNAGGDGPPTYYWKVYNASNSSLYTSGNTITTSFSLSSVPAGTYYAVVYAQNSMGAQSGVSSQSSNASVVSPPFFPFFPSFGPFFPYFPFFPSFGPYFPSFGGGGCGGCPPWCSCFGSCFC